MEDETWLIKDTMTPGALNGAKVEGKNLETFLVELQNQLLTNLRRKLDLALSISRLKKTVRRSLNIHQNGLNHTQKSIKLKVR